MLESIYECLEHIYAVRFELQIVFLKLVYMQHMKSIYIFYFLTQLDPYFFSPNSNILHSSQHFLAFGRDYTDLASLAVTLEKGILVFYL